LRLRDFAQPIGSLSDSAVSARCQHHGMNSKTPIPANALELFFTCAREAA
jgi:hypothetical protein